MHKFIFSILLMACCITVIAQEKNEDFEKEWLSIDTLIYFKEKHKDALNKVKKIQQKALQQQNSNMQIKALLYIINLEQFTTDNATPQYFYQLKSALSSTNNKVAKGILHSLLANYYWLYFNDKRYTLYGKQKVHDTVTNIHLWNADNFLHNIAKHYLLSIKETGVLQEANLETIAPLLTAYKFNNQKVCTTVYDILIKEAIEYFTVAENLSTKPINFFSIQQPEAFASSNIFTKFIFNNADSTNNHLLALKLFQNIEKIKANSTDALLYFMQLRLQFVYNNSTLSNKDFFYEKINYQLINTYKNLPNAVIFYENLVQLYNSKASLYKPLTDTNFQFHYTKSLALIEEAINNYSSIKNNTNTLKNIEKTIKEKQLQITTEKVNEKDLPFRALVEFKNIDTIYYRIAKVDFEDSIYYNTYQEKYWETVAKMPYQYQQAQSLPTTNDYQTHATEIKINALPSGAYAIISSTGKNFDANKDNLNICFTYVSNISVLKHAQNALYTVHRSTGKPLPNVLAIALQKKWDDANKKYWYTTIAKYTSNKDGKINLVPKLNNSNIEWLFETTGDRLRIREDLYYYNYMFEKKQPYKYNVTQAYYFLDRGIYRPGQRIFFKGIAINKTNSETNLHIENDSIWVYLHNTNRKKIDSILCKQNSYGSFTGSFTLPSTGLLGSFTINATKFEGSAFFKVEAYKKPTFFVQLHAPTKEYSFTDSIQIKGNANAYAGNTINYAKVSYSIIKTPIFSSFWRNNYTNTSTEIIADGNTITSKDGSFIINFLATNKLNEDACNYIIEATITDNAGETRTAKISIPVSNVKTITKLFAEPFYSTDSTIVYRLETKNIAGKNIDTSINITIEQIEQPYTILKERFWKQQDVFILSKEEYKKNFPYDNYADENNKNTWTILKKVAEYSVISNTAHTLQKLQPGSYKISYTGNKKIETVFIDVYSNENSNIANSITVFNNNITVEPNSKAIINTASNIEKRFVFQQIFSKQKDDNYTLNEVPKGIHKISIMPTEADRGGMAVEEIFVNNNRVYQKFYHIQVPFTNKQLNIEYATYRNKTEPGSKETYTVNIKGNQTEKIAAEMVTAMYDASLTQFVDYNFLIPNIWNPNYYSSLWSANQFQFTSSLSQSFTQVLNFLEYQTLQLPYLIKDGSHYWTTRGNAIEEEYIRKNKNYKDPKRYLYETVTASYNSKSNKSFTGSIATDISGRAAGVAVKQEEEYSKVFSGAPGAATSIIIRGNNSVSGNENIPVIPRTNFNETAFFFPQFLTDSVGNISFTTTLPDAITTWKWQSFAHTKNLQFAVQNATIVTQKQLMAQGNAPRFLREGDAFEFPVKLSNIANNEMTGTVQLELLDANTNTAVDGWFQNVFPTQYFTIEKNSSSIAKFPIQVPFNFNSALRWRVIAKAKNSTDTVGIYSIGDGEEKTIAVVTNKTLITESLPFMVFGDTTITAQLINLTNTKSETLQHQQLMVEYTMHPIYTVLKSLPYLKNYPYDCSEQTFHKLFANALTQYIVTTQPILQKTIQAWLKDSVAVKDNLQKNSALKQVLLEETPWVLDAFENENGFKNLVEAMQVDSIQIAINASIEQLIQKQNSNGSFGWFAGGQPNYSISQLIVNGLAKLRSINALNKQQLNTLSVLLSNALHFTDNYHINNYKKIKIKDRKLYVPTAFDLQYVYSRALLKDYAFTVKDSAFYFYYNQAINQIHKLGLYQKALLALACNTLNNSKFVVENIIPAIVQSSVENNLGMYWKNTNTYYWYNNDIDFEATILEVFKDTYAKTNNASLLNYINKTTQWLLLNKATNNWKTTTSTANACFALLFNNKLSENSGAVKIKLGNQLVNSNKVQQQFGTGYFSKSFAAKNIKNSMGNVSIATQNMNNTISYGALHWQYLENNTAIPTSKNATIQVQRFLFKEVNNAAGKNLIAIQENDELQIGDKVIVRLLITTDRNMEYIHVKDARSSTMEPTNILSGYTYKNGMYYYESTKDVSSNFFIDYLPKGVHTIEYSCFVQYAGKFNNGIATVTNMYAPEFSCHSNSFTINVKE